MGEYVGLRERLAVKIATREADPTGRRPSDRGAKVDAGKPRMDLVLGSFADALVEVAKVGTFGAKLKYLMGYKDILMHYLGITSMKRMVKK